MHFKITTPNQLNEAQIFLLSKLLSILLNQYKISIFFWMYEKLKILCDFATFDTSLLKRKKNFRSKNAFQQGVSINRYFVFWS